MYERISEHCFRHASFDIPVMICVLYIFLLLCINSSDYKKMFKTVVISPFVLGTLGIIINRPICNRYFCYMSGMNNFFGIIVIYAYVYLFMSLPRDFKMIVISFPYTVLATLIFLTILLTNIMFASYYNFILNSSIIIYKIHIPSYVVCER